FGQVRLARDDVDKAAGGVHAEQRALRAPQHLDTLDIEKILRGCHPGPRHENAVDKNPERRMTSGIALHRADAADIHRRSTRVPELQRFEAGCDTFDVMKACDLAFLDPIAADDGDRDRDILDILLAL